MEIFLLYHFLLVLFGTRIQCWEKGEDALTAASRTACRGRYTREALESSNYEIVIPRKVMIDGKFLSYQIPHHYKRSYYKGRRREEMTPEDMLHYRVAIDGEEHHLELYPNHKLLGPGAVLENRVLEDGQPVTDEEFLRNAKIRRLRDTECHYIGNVRDHGENSAISTCYGLAGYIRTKRALYMIEPLEGHDFTKNIEHPHVVYNKRKKDGRALCDVTQTLAKEIESRSIARRRRNVTDDSKFYTVELLAVLDKTLLDYHKDYDVENYVLTLFNMAAGLFQDLSLGVHMELVIVRIIRLEVQEDEFLDNGSRYPEKIFQPSSMKIQAQETFHGEGLKFDCQTFPALGFSSKKMNLSVNKDAEATLKYFQTWQQRMNPGDDTHPNHHDCAVLLTKIDICLTQSLCGFTGTSTIAGTCDPLKGAVLVKDNGLTTGYNIAHQIGHTLGMSHDSEEENGCSGITVHQDGYIETSVMYSGNPYVTKRWSKCSQSYVKMYLQNGMGTCLEDEAQDHQFSGTEMLPGVMYNGDDQCRLRYRQDVRQCDLGITCEELKCAVPGKGCLLQRLPPAEGTPCGEKKWCYQMKCLMIGEHPGAIDAGWSTWSPWSRCSRTCGSGVASSSRKCNRPQPSNGGETCHGIKKRHKICATEPCEIGTPSFRDVQCAEFNDWVFPEDGKTHQWIGYNLPENLKASENPCVLYCLSETKLLTSLKPKVVDGTTCYRGIRDICIGGVCKEIPCDLDMESNAVEDMCGVCKGDGTSCTLKEGTQFIAEQPHLKKLIDVPRGAKNIRVEEAEPTKSRIVVRTKLSKNILIDGNRLGMFDVPGSKAWLGMIRAKQEALNIPGPVSDDLVVLVYPKENVTLKYSLGLKQETIRTPEFNWDYIDWSRCDAVCGPGEEISVPRCVEKTGGEVDESFCKKLDKPDEKTRPCNQAPCVPRWMIGDWQGCNPCTPGCKKQRAVKCIRPVGHGEQEADIIAETYCQGIKPKESRECNVRTRRGSNNMDTDMGNKYEDDDQEIETDKYSVNYESIDSDDNSRVMKNGTEKEYRSAIDLRSNIAVATDLAEPTTQTVGKNSVHSSAIMKRTGKDNNETETPRVRKIKKGEMVFDKEDVKNLTLSIILERDDNNNIINFPNDFNPQPPPNTTVFTLVGMDAIKYIQRIQEDTNTSIQQLPP